MWKWIVSDWKFLRKAKAERARLTTTLSARPRLEALEDRLAPAGEIVPWRGPPMMPTSEGTWGDDLNWNGGAAPNNTQIAYFRTRNANAKLTAVPEIAGLTVRSASGKQSDTFTIKLNLNGNDLTNNGMTRVFSAAPGVQVSNIEKGPAANVIFNIDTSGIRATLTTTLLEVGSTGDTQAKGRQNRATLSIGSKVTVDVQDAGNPGIVTVGGKTVGVLEIDGGKLKAKILMASGVNVVAQAADFTQITVKNRGEIELSDTLILGVEAAPAKSPATRLVIDDGTVTVAASTDIGPKGPASVFVRNRGQLSANGKLSVLTGTLDVEQNGGVTVVDDFANLKNGTTIIRVDGLLDLRKGGENRGSFRVAEGGVLKARANGMINAGTLKGLPAAGGVSADFGLQGVFTQTADGHLLIHLAGNTAGVTHDRFTVSALDDEPGGGHAALGGHLDVTASYAPAPWLLTGQAGDHFTILSATAGLSGQFDPLTGLNLPDPASLMLPPPSPGHAYAWRVVYDTTDSFDPVLAAANPAFASQPWAGNGTYDVVLVLEEVDAPDLVITSANPGTAHTLNVGYRVDGQSIGSNFTVAVFASSNGVTPDDPNAPLAAVTVSGATVGTHTATLDLTGADLSAGQRLIAVIDAGGAVAEASEYNNALVLASLAAPDAAQPEGAGPRACPPGYPDRLSGPRYQTGLPLHRPPLLAFMVRAPDNHHHPPEERRTWPASRCCSSPSPACSAPPPRPPASRSTAACRSPPPASSARRSRPRRTPPAACSRKSPSRCPSTPSATPPTTASLSSSSRARSSPSPGPATAPTCSSRRPAWTSTA